MKHIIYKWLVGLMLFFTGSYAIGQNISFDINAACANSTLCSPFLSEYTCGTVKLQTTHGSPAFYSLTRSNSTIRVIELRAKIANDQGGNVIHYSEGLTLKYSFKSGTKYTIKIKHIAIPNTNQNPQIYAGFTSNPARRNDGCDVGLFPFDAGDDVNDIQAITVSSSEATTSFNYTAPKNYSYLWIFSNPVNFDEKGSLLISIEIVDNGTTPPNPTCYTDASYNFCDPAKTWTGSADVRAVNPITLGCDAFKSSSAPGAGAAFVRRFTAPSITLSPGFVASATDPAGAVRTLKILPSADPCNQALRVATSPISNVQTVTSATQLLENINIYPSPSRGLVNINFNSSDLLNAQISVTDQSGRVVYQMRNKVESNLVQLNLEHLSNGVYFIKVNTKNKVAVKKLLISK